MLLGRRITMVMKLVRRITLLVLATVVVASLAGTSARSAPEAPKPRLAAFGSCGQLLDYAKAQTKRYVGPYGFGGGGVAIDAGVPTAAPAVPSRAATPVEGVDYSGTNVQEEGVDEPD